MNTFEWIDSALPTGLEVRQVYGFIFSADGRILTLKDEGNFNLPGGKPENGESLNETLVRETFEEIQTTIHSMGYLGFQLVNGIEKFAQVRLVASIDKILPANKDPSTGRLYRRLLVPPRELNELLGWGDSGERQIASAIAGALTFGVFWDGEPLEYIGDN
ncbi:MAG: NUDIX domain-containing protein [Candidatus Nanopelagicaceae bacterium]|nr:NUDIX domain-containing protein [Candidatus Nanopelagicaceae bacterium]